MVSTQPIAMYIVRERPTVQDSIESITNVKGVLEQETHTLGKIYQGDESTIGVIKDGLSFVNRGSRLDAGAR